MSTALEISRTHLQRLLLMVEQSNWLNHPQQFHQWHEWEPSNQQQLYIITVISKGWGRKLVTKTHGFQMSVGYPTGNGIFECWQWDNAKIKHRCFQMMWTQPVISRTHVCGFPEKKIQQISSSKSSNGTLWRNPPNLHPPSSLTAGGSPKWWALEKVGYL